MGYGKGAYDGVGVGSGIAVGWGVGVGAGVGTGPLETTMSTAVPGFTRLSATGSVLMTRPAATEWLLS